MSTVVQRGFPDIVLDNAAAAAYLTARRDCLARGLNLHIYEPVGGLRTVEQIKKMQAAYDLPRGTEARARALAVWGMDANSRARPSTSSPHVSGLAVDVGGTGFSWLVANGTRYGLHQTLVAQGDLPHFEYKPGTAAVPLPVTSLAGLAGGGSTQIPEDDLDATQAQQLSNVESILGRLQNAILDPGAGVAKNAADASSAAQAAHQTATTVANLITDPNSGVLHAIASIQAGAPTDVRALAAALASELGPDLSSALAVELGKRLSNG